MTRKKKSWRSKNLYLTFRSHDTMILGINPLIGTDQDDDSVPTAEVVYNWASNDTDSDHYPLGMAVFEKDSKIYAIGGKILDPKYNKSSDNYRNALSNAFVSDAVYEFSNPNSPSCLVKPSVDVPKLPLPMPHPIVAKVKGEVYVLYGDFPGGYLCWGEAKQHDIHNCFLVLKKDEAEAEAVDAVYKWRPLPPPPFYHRHKWECYGYSNRSFWSVVADKLCMWSGSDVLAFDVETNRWNVTPFRIDEKCAITLSISVPIGGCFVVLKSSCSSEYKSVEGIHAILVDGAGNVLRTQLISDASPDDYPPHHCKFIELEEEEEAEDVQGSSATFLACESRGDIIAFSVVRVTLMIPLEIITSSPSWPESGNDDDFLEVEVLEKRRYVIGAAHHGFHDKSIDNVFFC